MKQKGFSSIFLLLIIILLVIVSLVIKNGSEIGQLIKNINIFPSATISPVETGNKVMGIQINTCCSCPTIIDSSKIGTDAWVLYEMGKNYSNQLPKMCETVDCAPCPEISNEYASLLYKCVDKSSLNCVNEPELSYQCTEKYQNWAKQNCPNWWGDQAVTCKDPRPEECTLECIGHPPYICGSDGKDYCSTCGACANKSVKWYVIRDTPCEVGFPL